MNIHRCQFSSFRFANHQFATKLVADVKESKNGIDALVNIINAPYIIPVNKTITPIDPDFSLLVIVVIGAGGLSFILDQ